MAEFVFHFDTGTGRGKQLLEQFGGLVRPAVQRALNRAADSLPKYITAGILREYHLPQSRVRGTFTVRKASLSELLAVVTSASGGVPLYLFGARPSQPGRRPPGGVQVDVMGRKPVPGSFVARMKSGHIGVFMRSGESPRLPMHELFGPSVPKMIEQLDLRTGERFTDDIAAEADRRFEARVGHEVDRLLVQLGAR